MKKNISELMDDAFSSELMHIAPEEGDTERIKSAVYAKIKVPAAGTAAAAMEPAEKKEPVKARKMKKGRVWRSVLAAAAVLTVGTTGVLAASGLLRLSENSIPYFAPASSQSSAAPSENSHDAVKPLFHQGMQPDLEQFNTPVGQTVSDSGVSMTLDTIAMDDNFVSLFLTVDYGKPIDFEAIYPDDYPGNGGKMPEYSKLIHGFAPSLWLSVDKSISTDGDNIWPESRDAYFVDDQTIQVSLRYQLTEDLPDECVVHARAFDMRDADGNRLAGQGMEDNAFGFSIPVDKSEAAVYTRRAEPVEQVFTVNRFEVQEEDAQSEEEAPAMVLQQESFRLKRLQATPFGTLITIGLDVESLTEEEIMAGGSPEVSGIGFNDLYFEDSEGNVLEVYHEPGTGYNPYAPELTEELLGLSPTAESITAMPLQFNPDGKNESRTYELDGIVGKKIETSSLGGYTVEAFTVSGGTVELQLRPYGHSGSYGYQTEFIFDDDNITLAGGRSGLIRQQYNRETGIYTYAVDYYAATEAELLDIKTMHVSYDEHYTIDRSQAVTIPLQLKK